MPHIITAASGQKNSDMSRFSHLAVVLRSVCSGPVVSISTPRLSQHRLPVVFQPMKRSLHHLTPRFKPRTSLQLQKRFASEGAQASKGAAQSAGPPPNLQERYRIIEEYLRIRGYNTLRIIGGLLVASGAAVYLSRHYLTEELSFHVADVTSRSLEQENVVNKANELSKGIVTFLLTDPGVSDQAVQFLQRLFSKQDTQAAVVHLLGQVREGSALFMLLYNASLLNLYAFS